MQSGNFITEGPSWVNGLSWADILIIVLYFLFVVYLGIRYSKSKDEKSYFLAGRGMTWPVIGFSLFAASISSSTLIGQAGDAYSTGIAVFNYNLVSVVVMIFFAWFILPFYIKSKIFTIPEFLEKRFNVASRYYFSAITIIVNIFLDAAGSLYAAAIVMKLVFPEVSIFTLSVIFAVIVAAYTIPGGLSAAIRVDLMQGIFLLVGSIVLTLYATYNGGAAYVKQLLVEGDILMKLVRPMEDSSVPWLGALVGIPILGLFFWGNNQQLVQRVLTAKNLDEGRKGVLLVGFLTVLTLFVIIIPGIMAIDLFPGLSKPDMVYPNLIMELLPNVLIGFMMAAMVAALTSSLSGLLNSVATLFTMDFYDKMVPHSTSKKKVRVGKIASITVLVIAVFWAPQIGKQFGTLLKYYQEMLSIMAPPIVAAFILGIFWKRTNAVGAFSGLMAGIALGIGNIIYSVQVGHSIFGDIHFLLTVPFYFLWSLLVMVLVSLATKKPPLEKTEGLVFSVSEFKKETASLKSVPLLKSYRFWSLALLVFCFITLIMYW
ncbi:SSS family solute:Na+ symporter [Kordia periserrulae]|uniref:SSS family solute:Na+ symporter n=1 Tax=Kordia periserrulae TaxID=701523 RepID=A0A2T6C0A5_9FLAO|nr:sodium:solute symporter [Kordia periserrulae]PTX61740.1 SSS family solute:Na+ symporter [Kordia periserrulae]